MLLHLVRQGIEVAAAGKPFRVFLQPLAQNVPQAVQRFGVCVLAFHRKMRIEHGHEPAVHVQHDIPAGRSLRCHFDRVLQSRRLMDGEAGQDGSPVFAAFKIPYLDEVMVMQSGHLRKAVGHIHAL